MPEGPPPFGKTVLAGLGDHSLSVRNPLTAFMRS
jgi:hypothetical protein